MCRQGIYPESHGIVGKLHARPRVRLTFTLKGQREAQTIAGGAGSRAIPLQRRILTMLQWLHLPEGERHDYFYTHKHVRLNAAVLSQALRVRHALGAVRRVRTQIWPLESRGMEDASCERTEFLSNYMSNVDDIILVPGSLGRIRSRHPNNPKYDPKALVANLTCKKPEQHFKPYLKQHLPKRLHYANNRRIEDIHLMVDRKWHVARKAPEGKRHCGFLGDHGYDNKITSMQTIFLGYGPTFKFKTKVPPFENIELYNVMCDLLGLKPAANNGTHGSLNHLLRSPVFRPAVPEEVSRPAPPAPVPTVTDDLGCACDDKVSHGVSAAAPGLPSSNRHGQQRFEAMQRHSRDEDF
ncbi:hypothetical protein CRUP_010793 [Coryphaenoides rupestris]|nr:hypothetical protein CRUP_010793 [Coryphaenoides rupestris]